MLINPTKPPLGICPLKSSIKTRNFKRTLKEEISDILRIPTNTVGTLMFRGKRVVKAICEKKGGDLML